MKPTESNALDSKRIPEWIILYSFFRASDCPKCGKYDIEFWYTDSYGDRIYKCANCGNIIKD